MIAANTRILWLPGDDSRNWDYETGGWASSNRNPSGVKVDAETALRSTVVLACIRVLSTSVAGLPFHLYRRLPGGGKEIAREHPLYRILHTQPNSWQTSFEWREQMMLHLLSHGFALDEKVYSGGAISEIVPLHPSRVKTEQLENNRLRYTYREASGSSTVYTQDAVMSVRGMSDDGVNGMSTIELARDAIGLARACEIHGATFFGSGARPGVILSTDQMLSPEAAENTRNQWERAHRGPDRSHRTAVLQGGLKVNELGGNNQESQFLEARRFQVEEVCRLFGVPPHLVGDLTRSSFSNIEQQSLDFLTNGLMPYLRRIESSIARDLLEGDDEYFAEFDTRGVLRADAAGRGSYYNTLWNLGVLSVNEIRSLENLNPVDSGDVRFVQLNMTTLEKAAAEPEVPVVEEVITVEEPAADAPVAEEPQQLADVSLNGAQIASLLEILTQVSTGLITADAAKALVMASFPSIPQPMIDRILAGTSTQPVAEEPAPEPLAASFPASRAMTISVDFDRTFAADPQLWGEFARQSAAAGNRVVMVSRRPDTPENQDHIAQTLGDYREAFDAVLLVGERLKDEAAREAGVEVDVWVDDSPQFIRGEQRAAPDAVDTGDFVSWGSGDGRGRGRITRVVRDGEIDVPDSSFTITGTEDDPAALIRVYRELADGWSATDTLVGHKFSTLTKIDPLESRAELGDIVEGDTVTWGDGLVGIVNHIMLTGTLNLGETEMEATPDDPAVLVSLITDGEVTNVQEAVKLAALTKVESNAYGYGKPRRKPRRRKGG
jgi:HK97 family phage portal protein